MESKIPESIANFIPNTLKNRDDVMETILRALGDPSFPDIRGDVRDDWSLTLAVIKQAKTPTVFNGMRVALMCNTYDAYITRCIEKTLARNNIPPTKQEFMSIFDEMLDTAHRLGEESNGDVNDPSYKELLEQLFTMTTEMYKNPFVTKKYPGDRLTSGLKSMIEKVYRCKGEFTSEYLEMSVIADRFMSPLYD